MAGNHGSRQHDGSESQKKELSGGLADHLLGIALEKRKLAKDHIQQVYDSVPAKYHKHIRILSQKEKIWDKEFFLTDEQRRRGLHSYHSKTFVETFRPYVDVEGRITEMIDVHQEHDSGYTLETYADQIGTHWVIECVFDGLNKKGQQVKTRDRAVIGFGGTGVDATNPIENATTSAVGRSLAQAGYGCIGSGLTSFEDMFIDISRQKALEDLNNERKSRVMNQNDRGDVQDLDRDFSSTTKQTSEPDDPVKMKNSLINQLINLTKGFDQTYVKNRIPQLLKVTFNGRFNSLEVGQLRLVEMYFKQEIEDQQVS
ncbi:hypothetical protein M4D81_29380 [Paenibacillus sp. p3-SID867]|uniref:hypothetical protein n=1 Tax=Paenibacillus sp. p3-SID867 TaxID=2916363 RepID=UPI0021A262E9|nr:hypothetical protein [Paenibacillus sp. p3-SID867]MCT1403111.1 hypothetical protein [Paenibacillus sp. p3-SID867]